MRWTALGTHRGYGLYGIPTGRRVHLWGISQLYFVGEDNGAVYKVATTGGTVTTLSDVIQSSGEDVVVLGSAVYWTGDKGLARVTPK